ncbi:hypothetical protein KUW04_11160 [Halomonas denitrificans]|nr:hypothetical protein [Halomonas denitrificans]
MEGLLTDSRAEQAAPERCCQNTIAQPALLSITLLYLFLVPQLAVALPFWFLLLTRIQKLH